MEAKALFEHLLLIRPELVQIEQLRAFQRRVRQWRLARGPAPEVIFPQNHRPGEVMQLDWTHAKELEIRIADQRPFETAVGAPLLLRGYRDFANEAAYDGFLAKVLTQVKGPRTVMVAEELAVMRELLCRPKSLS